MDNMVILEEMTIMTNSYFPVVFMTIVVPAQTRKNRGTWVSTKTTTKCELKRQKELMKIK